MTVFQSHFMNMDLRDPFYIFDQHKRQGHE